MVEYLLTLSLLGGLHFPDVMERVQGAVSNPFVLIVIVGLGLLLMRTRVR